MAALENLRYRFRDCELEPAERRLRRAGKAITLTPKVFDTLVLLVMHAGHVVSKDELMTALWPRGYVDESNLTKHIWLIRRALGDDEHESKFIETVSKRGYRFVAEVVTGPAPQPPAPATETTPPLAPVDATGSHRRRRWIWIAAGALVVLALTIWWRLSPPRSTAVAGGRTGIAVAFVVFSNLSHNPKDAWISPALAEMLGAELTVANELQVVPDELVRNASTDLAPPAAGGYAPQTLERLRQRLGADYIVSGSYLVSGATDDAPMRVDIALQDARSGAMVASVSNQGGASRLLAFVSSAGATLRGKLGIEPPGIAALGLVAASQPPNLEVARRVGFALDALQHYDAARARDELLEAIAESPGYAPAYSFLSQAWSALGYRDKARAAAEQALQFAGSLPREQRLLADAVVETARNDLARAANSWQALAQLKPLNTEYRLQWIDAQVAAGMMSPAQAGLTELRKLPHAAADPRVELAAARIAAALDDAKSSATHAANALQLAQQRQAAGLVANALVQLASARTHLGQNEDARANLETAIASYRSLGNPRGEAIARSNLATVLSALNLGHAAREELQRAMALYQGIGDVNGVAVVYREMTSQLWVAGDREGAQAAAHHSLDLARETGDLRLQSWVLRALATIAADDSASDEVMDEYREVIALNERIHDAGGHVWSLTTYADVERLRGNLGEARTLCARARAEAATLSDKQFSIYSDYTCALVDADQGNAAAAHAGLEAVLKQLGSQDDATYRADSLTLLAQLDMDAARWRPAAEQLRLASRAFAAAEVQTGEAGAQALLALCDQVLGDTAGRDQAAARARLLRQSMSTRQEVYVVDIALIRLAGENHTDAAAVTRLLALATDAEQRHWLAWSLEAKLAAWEILRASDTGAATTLRTQIETSARAHDFGRILKLLQRPVRARDRSAGIPNRR
jgi:DNA-binding winged helix-turn-helix (wHTH) protein/tetratricopeptide (TPR) repeat protein